jgi:amino acid adenylation domain-containing protein
MTAPLSFAQERLWFLHQLDPTSTRYNVPTALRFTGPLDSAALQRALTTIVTRHEVLRTVFAAPDGVPRQLVRPPAACPLPVTDISASRTPMIDAEQVVARAAGLPFDLTTGPLLRARLVRLGEQEHLLVLVLHHIVSDEWSTRVLQAELSALYAAYSGGHEPALPAPAMQYADFAAQQRALLTGQRLEELLGYWRRRLAGLEPLTLPGDRPRDATGRSGAVAEFDVPERTCERLRRLGRGSGCTFFMLLLAAYQAVLARHCGTTDVAVGTTVAHRAARAESLIGCFLNTLILRTDLSGDPTFTELLTRVKATVLGALEHQDLPFERLVDELAPARDLHRPPLCQVAFTYHEAQRDGGTVIGGTSYCSFPAPPTPARFDATLTAVYTPEAGLHAAVEYDPALFDRATIESLADHFTGLLAAVADDPARPLSGLPLLAPHERATLLRWSGRDAAFSPGSVPERIAHRAAGRPGAPAVIAGTVTVSYAGLIDAAGRLAARLARHRAGPETIVGLAVPPGPDLVTAIFGVWRAGCAYLPIDPDCPPRRAEWMLRDAKVTLVVTTAGSRQVPPDLTTITVGEPVMEERAEDLAAPPAATFRAPHPAQLAYVIYTSGSTGQPKGVAVPHGALTNLAEAQRREFGIRPGDRVLQFAPAGFDASVWELVLALNAGATAVFADAGARRDPALLAEQIGAHAVTVATLPPALLGYLDPAALGSVRLLISAGDRLPAATAARWSAGRRLVNAYGPTEATVCAAFGQVADTTADPPIGRPVANMRCYVVDTTGQLAPAGAPGELVIGGAGVSRGYIGSPGLTAERFVADAITGTGGRLYRTGDRARWRRDGTLEFLGRLDDQISARGWRIEPGEAEAALVAHPAIRAAAVAARPAPDGGQRLVAWLVPDGPEPPSARDLRAHLAGRLPAAAVPAEFIPVAELPLTSSGKVDRRALPTPPVRQPTAPGPPPQTVTQKALAGIWAGLLGMPVCRTDSFFDLGGHSLLVIRMVNRVQQDLGRRLPVRAVFETPVLDDLAARLDALAPDGDEPIGPADRDRPLPLSFAQQRLWFLQQLDPASTEYMICYCLRLTGPLDTGALRDALVGLVARHEPLRTTFSAATGVPEQVIGPPGPVPLPVTDACAAADPVARAVAELQRHGREPVDLATGPVFRPLLVKVGHEDHALGLAIHHAVADEWSIQVLVRDLLALYRSALPPARREPASGPHALPPLKIQYADYAAWQRHRLTGDRLERQLAYWRARLAGLRPAELPADRPHPAVRDPAAGWLEFAIPAEVTAGLRQVARAHRVTMFMVVLAALQALLARYSGRPDVAVGTPVAGRDRPETEPLVGPFINTVVLRTDVSGDPAFTDLLARVKDTVLGAFAHAEVPFERLVEELAVVRDRGRHPLVQVAVNYSITGPDPAAGPGGRAGPDPDSGPDLGPGTGLDVADGPGTGDGPAAGTPLTAQEFSPPSDLAKFDLRLVVEESAAQLEAGLQYRCDLFGPDTAGLIAGHLCAVLAAVAGDPAVRLHLLPPPQVAPAAGRRPAPAASGRRAAPSPGRRQARRAPPLASLLSQHAASRPGRPAVADPATTLSYAELACRAAGIAGDLRALGLPPESVVALALPHSADLLAAVAGVWWAGAAFLVLDPADPLQRLRHKVLDAGTAALVTTPDAEGDLPDLRLPTVLMDGGGPGPGAAHPAEAGRLGPCHPDQLAYLVYTSGSTGAPKRTGISHGNLAAYAHGLVAALRPARHATWALPVPLSVDLGLTAMAAALVTAGCVRLIDPDTTRDPQAFVHALAAAPPDYLKITPTHLRMLLAVPGHAGALPRRGLVLGGEPTPPALLEALASSGYQGEVHNHYGPAETTVGVLTYRAADHRSFPLGLPLGDTGCRVLDHHGCLVPDGVPGELYLAGAQVGRGYLGRPDLTAERFTADPLGPPGARLYRTGDLVRRGADGVLHFLGRCDDQINLHGHRIEPAEIEVALGRHPQVAAAVVAVRPDPAGNDRLAAWFVPDAAGPAPGAAQLRAFLASSLPAALVPAVFAEITELPLTPSGKVDRNALPDPAAAIASRSVTPPATPTELALAGLWSALLGVADVGSTDNFFDLGGHSLLATQLTARVRAELGAELPLAAIFDHPELAALAAVIDTLLWIGDGAPAGDDAGPDLEEIDL